MSEGPQQDNNPTIPSGMKPISEEALRKVETPHITNVTEGTDEVQGLHDRNKRAMDKALFEQEEFHKAKTRRKVIFTAIASFAAATVLALGGVSLLNRLSSNSPSQALLDSNKQLNGLETVVSDLRATGTRLSADKASAIASSNSYSNTLGICYLNLNDTKNELNDRKAKDAEIYKAATSVFNQNITLTERINVISNTVLSPSEIISRMAEALTNGDQETVKWLNDVGCVVPPTETPTATSTTIVLPSWTPTRTPTNTATPSSTPTIVITPPENPTDTPVPANTPTKAPEATFPAKTNTVAPTWTLAASATLPPTNTLEPTRTPIATSTTAPTKAPEATFPAQTRTVTP